MDDINTAYWEDVAWLCPICAADSEEGRVTPTLTLIDTGDPSIDKRDIWGVGDDHDHDFDFELWKRANPTEPVVVCPECETVFDVEFIPRPRAEGE